MELFAFGEGLFAEFGKGGDGEAFAFVGEFVVHVLELEFVARGSASDCGSGMLDLGLGISDWGSVDFGEMDSMDWMDAGDDALMTVDVGLAGMAGGWTGSGSGTPGFGKGLAGSGRVLAGWEVVGLEWLAGF
jgi:hypothetical protein